jgi:hypothetical protein
MHFLGFSDTTYCTYYEKSLDLSDDWWSNLTGIRYKIKQSRVYCGYDEYCCGSRCCRGAYSNNNYYDDSYAAKSTKDSSEM